MIDKTLKLLICFMLLVPLLGTQVNAESNYDHNALMEYEGYGKAMYDSIVEQTTFITGQYTDNKDYVRNSMNEIKDYADFWYNEYNDFDESCNKENGLMNCLGEMVERGGAYVLTLGDWVKKLFGDYEQTVPGVGVDYSFYENALTWDSIGKVVLKPGWTAKVSTPNDSTVWAYEKQGIGSFYSASDKTYQFSVLIGNATIYKTEVFSGTEVEVDEIIADWRERNSTVSGVVGELFSLGANVSLYYNNELKEPNTVPPNDITTINNYIQDNPVEVQVPELKPTLVCPDGTKIQMSISGSTFLAADGSVLLVNKDGTAEINGSICNLNWEKPKVDYVDGNASIIDPDGNWLDIDKGTVNACLDPNGCKPKELDNSLLEYVKNAYQYATNFLKTATDGLKSLATGAKDLTSLFGVFFSWLPTEMVVLMTSGLGITIGLRLFRK